MRRRSSIFKRKQPSVVSDRVVEGIQVLYTFLEGDGNIVNDVSGSGTPLNLTIAAPASMIWAPSGFPGIEIFSPGTIINSSVVATKIINAAKASNEITLEAWITSVDPAANEPSSIMALSANASSRGATLGQKAIESPSNSRYFYNVRLNTSDPGVNPNGKPDFLTDETYFPSYLQHVIYTRNSVGIERIYVNGELIEEGTRAGNFSSWANNYLFALADENVTGNRNFIGIFFLASTYAKALTAAEVLQNFNAGFKAYKPPKWAFSNFEVGNIASNIVVLELENTIAINPVEVASAFTVLVDSNPNAVINVDLSTPNQVRLTLTSPVTNGQTVKISYTKGANPIRDNRGTTALNFADVAVTNNVPNAVPVASNVVLTVYQNILSRDDFTGTVIDSQKWNILSPNVEISQNGILTLTDTAGGVVSRYEDNRIESVDTFAGSDFIAAQCNLDFSHSLGISQGFALWIDSNNYVTIFNNGNIAQDLYSILIKKNGVTQLINQFFAVTFGKDVRIVKDLSGMISFEYWNGAWAQLADDIPATNFEILPSDQLRVAFLSQSSPVADERTMIIDNVFITKQPYSTQFPQLQYILNGSYDYSDVDSDPEANSVLKLFKDDDGAGTNRVEVTPFPGLPYAVPSADVDKSFYLNVIPVAVSGASPGVAVESAGVQIPQRLGLIAVNNESWTNHFWAGNDPFSGDSTFEFMFGNPISDSPEVIVGLDASNPGSFNPNASLYNFFWLSGTNQLRIRTNTSSLKIINTANLTPTDVLRIVRLGSDIQFWVKGVLEHTVTGGSTADLYAYGTMSQSGPTGRFEKYAVSIPKIDGVEIGSFTSLDNIQEFFG